MRSILLFILTFTILQFNNSFSQENVKKPIKIVFERSDGSVYEKMAGAKNFVEIVPGKVNPLITDKLVNDHQKIVITRSNGDVVYSFNFMDWYDEKNNSKVETSRLAKDLPNFSITPNPTNGEYLVSFELERDSRIQSSIYTYNGMKIADLIDAIYSRGEFNHRFDINKYTSGVYIIQFVIENNIYTYKIVKN